MKKRFAPPKPKKTSLYVYVPFWIHDGGAHILDQLKEHVCTDYFQGRYMRTLISWTKPAGYVPRNPRDHRGFRVSKYWVECDVIYIHHVFNHKDVPASVIRWLIFHELLHRKHGIKNCNGRRCFHSPEFRAEERRFSKHQFVMEWLYKNRDWLYRF